MSTDNPKEHVALGVAAEPSDDDEAPPSRVRLSKGVSDAELRALLGRRDTLERIRQIVVARVHKDTPRETVEDLVQDATVAALTSKSRPRSMDTARGWLGAVSARAVAMHFRRNAKHDRWLRPDAEVEELRAEPDDGLEPGWSVSGWLATRVGENPRDQETYELLVYKAQTGKSLAEVAADHAMTTAALKNRIHKLKARYEPQWRKRERLFVFLWLLGAGVVALVAVVAWLFWRASLPVIGPDVYPPTPKPTVTVTPPPFEPAQPTQPNVPVNDKPPFP